jgi:hypothetical protein
MAWRGSIIPFPGLFGEYEGDAREVYQFDAANTLTRLTIHVTDPPDGGTVVVRLWNNEAKAGAEGVAYLEATIADGETFASVTGSVAITESLWQEIVTGVDDDAMNLSGEYEMITASGISTYFTTLGLVKDDLNESGTDTARDTILNALIAGVTRQMQEYMGRDIVQGTATAEKLDGWYDEAIYTEHYPIVTDGIDSLEENGSALTEDTGFESLGPDRPSGRIVRISGGSPVNWSKGRRNIAITYDHGYVSVPDDLVMAATAYVCVKYFDTVQSGKNRRGVAAESVDPNSTASYEKDFWKREVVPVMAPYRKRAA